MTTELDHIARNLTDVAGTAQRVATAAATLGYPVDIEETDPNHWVVTWWRTEHADRRISVLTTWELHDPTPETIIGLHDFDDDYTSLTNVIKWLNEAQAVAERVREALG